LRPRILGDLEDIGGCLVHPLAEILDLRYILWVVRNPLLTEVDDMLRSLLPPILPESLSGVRLWYGPSDEVSRGEVLLRAADEELGE
jgi:hypothetical protein